MEDLNRSYSVDEFKAMTLKEFVPLETLVKKNIDDYFSKDERKILSEAKEINDSPYHFRMNPSFYKKGMEEEAEEREMEMRDTVNKANDLHSRLFKDMPPNMKKTLDSFISFRKR